MTFDFRQKFSAARGYDDKHFAALLLQADPLAGKLTSAQREQIIGGAMQCGIDVARMLGEQFSSAAPSEIARLMGLKIAEGGIAGKLVLSSYDANSATITLHRSLTLRVKQWAAEEELLPPFELDELAIAHELFHVCESRDSEIFSRRFKVTLWRLGPLQNRSTVPAAGEIAAASCAKRLCCLGFSPILLEPVILRSAGAESVEAWFDRLERAKQGMKDGCP